MHLDDGCVSWIQSEFHLAVCSIERWQWWIWNSVWEFREFCLFCIRQTFCMPAEFYIETRTQFQQTIIHQKLMPNCISLILASHVCAHADDFSSPVLFCRTFSFSLNWNRSIQLSNLFFWLSNYTLCNGIQNHIFIEYPNQPQNQRESPNQRNFQSNKQIPVWT